MNRKYSLVVLFILSAFSVYAGEGEYDISRIPSQLLKHANVVKRKELLRFEITEENKARYRLTVAYTILNEQGDPWAYFGRGYDNFRSIESFEGALFDAHGTRIKTLRKTDIKDIRENDDANLADDNRIRWHSFFYKVYPYTVEYRVEIRYRGTMFLPEWIPQEKPVMSVEQSDLTVICPAANPLRYKMFNYKGEPVITGNSTYRIYSWEVKNINAIEQEYASPPWHQLTASVFLATGKFVLGDYQGSNASWKEFGRFVYDLKKDRDVLPDEIREKVHQLVAGITDNREKIRRLYSYLQHNTRYVSVQLGVGGWQPFDAKYVATRKYGDCKALTNFMYSLLREAGIRSVYTLINTTDEPEYLMEDFPCSQFNHVILFIPEGKDTTWLECTSQDAAPGYLGSIGNRYALAVDENGGTLVRTPHYGIGENTQVRKTVATLDETGKLEAVITTKYRGLLQDGIHSVINGLTKDKLLEFLKENIELATYDVRSFDYTEEKSAIPLVAEKLDLVADNYASVSGKRLFIYPNVITRSHLQLKTSGERKSDLVLDFEFKMSDSTEIRIPPGYLPESIPVDQAIETRFGKYSSSVKVSGDRITYYRHYEHYCGRFPASGFNELAKFYEAVYRADRTQVVLVKN